MPPRYAYWTIIAGGLPTAFRAADRDDLLPTFARIKEKHPDAEMKWFARGRLWESPESARQHADLQRRARTASLERPRGDRDRARPGKPRSARPSGESRGRDWRPGGDHRDPRQKFKDAKKARNIDRRRQKFERRQRFDEKTADARRHNGPDRRPPRRFESRSFHRNQDTGEPQNPPRPPRPNREPRPKEGHEPTPPPRPNEPVTTPPGPPERGRRNRPGPRGRFRR